MICSKGFYNFYNEARIMTFCRRRINGVIFELDEQFSVLFR
jgi:hypothetical protein